MPLPSSTSIITRVSSLWLLAGLSTAPATAQGRIIVIGDEWLLSDLAFTNNPSQSTQLAQNIAGYFANNQPGNFLVLSNISAIPGYGARGVQGTALATAMAAAGHTWTINPSLPITLGNLSPYDGVFLAGTIGSGPTNAAVLANYVNSGGSVFVMAGVGTGFAGAASEAAAWNPFLNTFGLALGTSYFATVPTGLIPIPVAPTGHALGQSLTTVSWGNGQLTLDLESANPSNQVAVRGDFTGFAAPQGVFNDIIATYNLGTVSPVYAVFGNGCAGSAGVPTNTASALPRIGQTMVATIGQLPPAGVAMFLLGFSRTNSVFGPLPLALGAYGAPGCTGYVSSDAVDLLLGSGGAANFNLAIPASQTYLGFQFFTQALVVDPGWNTLGAVVSDAAAATIGN